LVALAVRDGKPDPVVVEALADRHPARRIAAGVALARAGAAGKVPALPKLLQDPKPRVRLLVGLALARARQKEAVPVLIALLEEGRAVDLDRNNKPRWQVDGLKFPLDAQYLPGDRVLVAEYQGARVSERNRKGEVVWEKGVLQPLVAQRLANGNTFIATSNQ